MTSEAVARQAQELAALYATVAEINSQRDLKALLNAIIERAVKLTGASSGGLYLIEPDNKTLRFVVGYNMPEVFIGIKLTVGKGVTGRAASLGVPVLSGGQGGWKGRARVSLGGALVRRALAVPLKLGEKVIGVISLSDEVNIEEFGEQDIRLVGLFAHQAALAVEKARLYEEERQRSYALERSNRLVAALSRVGTLMQATLDASQMMETVGSELKQMGIDILIALLENQTPYLTLQYVSAAAKALTKIEKDLGIALVGWRFPQAALAAEGVLNTGGYLYISDARLFYQGVFADLSRDSLRRVMRLLGVTRGKGVLCLPMTVKEQALGVVCVWGEDIHEQDAPAFSIFANQTAVTLENSRLYAELQKQALHDELTGLYNRRGFFMLAEQQLKISKRLMTPFHLIFIDMDRLKVINDTFGHQEGDQALIDAANVLRQTFRASDIIARIGGDEFVVIVTTASENSLDIVMERLTKNIDMLNRTPGRKYSLSMSRGIIPCSPGQSETIDGLLSQADALMYAQKRIRKLELIGAEQA
ncbi:MAG: sensor domain-containing diguanylate cyclase [Anaerolineae bacterium]|nr:sensor domain-containing diguanylate cyclase [Anaerolineae bacterium]